MHGGNRGCNNNDGGDEGVLAKGVTRGPCALLALYKLYKKVGITNNIWRVTGASKDNSKNSTLGTGKVP